MSRLHSLHRSTRPSGVLSAHHFPHTHRTLLVPDNVPALGANDLTSLGLEGAVSPVLGTVLGPAEALDTLPAVCAPDSLLTPALSVERALGQHRSDSFPFVPVVLAGLMNGSRAFMQRYLAKLVLVPVGAGITDQWLAAHDPLAPSHWDWVLRTVRAGPGRR